jgi:hypothetical protein
MPRQTAWAPVDVEFAEFRPVESAPNKRPHRRFCSALGRMAHFAFAESCGIETCTDLPHSDITESHHRDASQFVCRVRKASWTPATATVGSCCPCLCHASTAAGATRRKPCEHRCHVLTLGAGRDVGGNHATVLLSPLSHCYQHRAESGERRGPTFGRGVHGPKYNPTRWVCQGSCRHLFCLNKRAQSIFGGLAVDD